MPPYAKYLKNFVLLREQLMFPKKTFLASNVSSILSHQILIKYKDPGCPTISIVICDKTIQKALLDLGTSVNLLPFWLYEQLSLGKLKSTIITLQLADKSIRIPKEVIEDVLIKVGEFIFPVDFIVIEIEVETDQRSQIPVILERPFLATSNALSIVEMENGIVIWKSNRGIKYF
ncbi:hypothetical protein AXF42_Ash000766 [Apostasia shenzhenica]|uniref:Aspartic peptidase DDI1-type domain-containing protein n=1 Tax=Apostasia shenzhenica TaxID=1088818 RepID=A0A2I0AHB3_9ASPA|nr:hypothetical protein AXF42_Ash000766 [Apostasia shenzhenica]